MIHNTEEITFRQFIKEIAKWLNRHYLIKTLFSVIPFAVGILVSTPLFGFAVTDGKINSSGWLVLFVAGFIFFALEGASNYVARNDNDNSKSYRSESQIRKKVAETEVNFSEEKNDQLRAGYKSLAHNNNQFKDFVQHYVKPAQRTNDILKQISFCIEQICDVPQTNIVHSAIINIDDAGWTWLCKTNTAETADLCDMIGKESSIEACLKEGGFYYSNSKKLAIQNKKYIPDRKDKGEDNIGSIICWEIKTDMSDNPETNHELKMLISFSTYGKQLLDQEANEISINHVYKDIIYKLVLMQYKAQLNENLIWYAMQKL